MIYQCQDTTKVEYLFQNYNATMITSCLQKIMGKIYVDDLDNPQSAIAILGDFCYVAGTVNEDMLSIIEKDFMIVIPCHQQWQSFIEEKYQKNIKKITRYAFKKEKDIFCIEQLENIVSHLPQQYQMKLIDKDIYNECQKESWCHDFVSQYKNYQSYQNLGIGVVIVKDNQLISGAFSYSRYREGIEIEIDTHIDYRKQGLARICAAQLILECLKRNLYPSWDAHNQVSAHLAKTLGYHIDKEYIAYELYK